MMPNSEWPEDMRYARAIAEENAERLRWQECFKDLRQKIQWLESENQETILENQDMKKRFKNLETEVRALAQGLAELEARL